MPVKKDAAGHPYLAFELELPGTPEQVWQAMATGPGYSAWFVPTDIEEREGGAVAFHLGGGATSSGRVTAWQPPLRFAFEEIGWSGDAPPLATEIVIEARDGGVCRVRMVHSLFTTRTDWDDEIAGMETGWPAFFRILRLYLRDFAGMPTAAARPTGAHAGTLDDAWQTLRDALRLTNARPGDAFATAGDAPRLAGTVEEVHETPKDRGVTLRLREPAPGAALLGAYEWGGKVHVPVSLYFYGDDAAAVLAEEGPRWEAWLAERFPQGGPGAGEPGEAAAAAGGAIG